MRSKRPFVIVVRKLLDLIETRMMELFVYRLNLSDKASDKSAPAAAVSQADVLGPTGTGRIDVAGWLPRAGLKLRRGGLDELV
jgi:glyoxylate reductase